MRLGLVLRKWRVVSELTLREVAGEIGIGYATLLRIEQGEDVDGRTLIRVAAWLTEKIQAKA
jgi:transcriptional regulator with XRE-family HTH domain